MPDRYIDGIRYIWDRDSNTWIIAGPADDDEAISHASGGTSQLTNPAVDRMTPNNPSAVGILAPRHAHKCTQFNEYGYCTECGRHFLNGQIRQEDDWRPFNESAPIPNENMWDDSFPSMISSASAAISSDERHPMQKNAFWNLLAPLAMGAIRALGGGAAAGAAGAEGAGLLGQAAPAMSSALRTKGVMSMMPGSQSGDGIATMSPQSQIPEVIPPMTYASTHEAADGDSVDIHGEDASDFFGQTDGFLDTVDPDFGLETVDLGGVGSDSPADELAKELITIIPVQTEDMTGDDIGMLASLEPKQVEALAALASNWDLVQEYANNDSLDGSENPIIVALDDLLEEAFPGYRSEIMDATEDGGDSSSDEGDSDESDVEDFTDGEDNDEDSAEEDESDTDDEDDTMKEASVKEARRLPRMCPHHKALVETSLALGDPASALQSMAQHEYGPKSCKGDWEGDDGKGCKYKPQMMTQSYWDERAEKAEQKRVEKQEQQAADLEAQPEAEADILDYDFGVEEPTAEWEDGDDLDSADEVVEISPADFGMAVASRMADDYDFGFKIAEKSDYEPANEGDLGDTPEVAPNLDGDDRSSAIEGGENAKLTDSKGRPLEKGAHYLLKTPNYAVPDKVTIDHIRGDKVTFTINTNAIDYQTDVSLDDIRSQRYEFEPVKGDEPGEFAPLPSDEDVADIDPDVVIDDAQIDRVAAKKEASMNEQAEDLFWSIIDREVKVAKTAGTVTPSALKEIMDEGEGVVARNAGRLDLTGTHYERMSDNDIADLFG